MITLGIGNLELDWGKNWAFTNHSALFRPEDVTLIDYHYVGDANEAIVEKKEGYSRPLRRMLPRLERLGASLTDCEREYQRIRNMQPGGDNPNILPFDDLKAALAGVDVMSVSPEYDPSADFGHFFRRELVDRLGFGNLDRDVVWATAGVIENYDATFVLRLLAENLANLDVPVEWRFADVVEEDWVKRSDVVQSVGYGSTVLIVTEGSSDAHIIAKALEWLRPETRDFFRFIDMAEGYPFSGTGQLHKFCQGLVKIGVAGRVLVIYDNDTEGSGKFASTRALALPDNMKVMKLPDMAVFKEMLGVGPDGERSTDINGKAAAIECYLDLTHGHVGPPKIRWTSFDKAQDQYQGELIRKESYAKAFFELRHRASYDFSGLEAIITAIEAAFDAE
jgi:hypothetical protein